MINCLYKYKGKPLTQYCRETGLPYSSVYNKIMNGFNIEDAIENTKLKTDCKTLAKKLLQVKPELREWLEVNFKKYL